MDIVDPEGRPPISEGRSYPSVLGWLDITFAMSQRVRVTHCPKKIDEIAVKTISRYLTGTRDVRTFISLPSRNGLDSFSDSVFRLKREMS